MGFEPTTASLEGWNSTTELRPQISPFIHSLADFFVTKSLAKIFKLLNFLPMR